MRNLKIIATAGLACIFAAGLSGCAILAKCSPENCASDKLINAQVSELFSQHPEFGAPAELHIQTINGVVYLSGAVNTDFEVRTAETLARQVANVKDVQNNLYRRGNSR